MSECHDGRSLRAQKSIHLKAGQTSVQIPFRPPMDVWTWTVYFFKPSFAHQHLVPSLHGRQMGKQCQTLFLGAPKSLQMVTAAMKLKDACSLEGNL